MTQDPFQKLTTGRSKGRPPKSFEMPPNSCMENQIILHAKTLFRQKGFSSISISEIVESIGVSKPTLYYYFKDKEHLYTSVLCHMLSIGGEYIQEEMNQAYTTQDKLRRLASGYFEHSPTSITSMMKDSIEHLSKPSQEKVYEAYENHIIQPFVNLFQKAFETKEISNPNARELAQMFVSLLDALVINYTVSEGRQFNFNLKANMLIQVLFDGIAFSLTQT